MSAPGPRRPLEHRPLGASGLSVSALSLGSWRTFERLPQERALAVIARARASGIDFLDDARYDDETGRAPIPSGYSEVLFGELFRAAGWPRAQAIVSNKLWWEFWPSQSALAEVDGSLERMGFERLDLIYASTLPAGLEPERAVAEVASVIEAGRAAHWGVVTWQGGELLAAVAEAQRIGLEPPCAVQLPYSLVRRAWATQPQIVEALERSGAALVASASLAGGILSGKYARAGAGGRMSERLGEAAQQPALRAAAELAGLAERHATTSAALALAFALTRPHVATVLFGATTPDQIDANIEALELASRLHEAELEQLAAIGVGAELPTVD
ncbi:MAG TPA: aldo/keto reductase [Solirubrobacteraceae bacterium]|nr:aldo/keto reductase [Solirubrobacteraceae bacterium]